MSPLQAAMTGATTGSFSSATGIPNLALSVRAPANTINNQCNGAGGKTRRSGVRARANRCSERLVFQVRGNRSSTFIRATSILLHARIQKAKPLPGEAGASIQEPLFEGGIEGRGPRYPNSYVARSRAPRAARHYILAMKQGATSAVPGAGARALTDSHSRFRGCGAA